MIMANQEPKQSQPSVAQPPKPRSGARETGTIRVEAHFRISDPATKQVYVEGRA